MTAKPQKTALRIELPDGTEKVVSKFDPPTRSLFPGKPKTRKRAK